MKVIVCGPKETIISIRTCAFAEMIGEQIGDSFYAKYRYDELAGKSFDLSPMMKAMHEVKIAQEIKSRLIDQLGEIEQKIERAFFPLEEIKSIHPKMKGKG